jgi:phosphoglycolate phosphatase
LVFDLDGTLVDSYPAITASLNHARNRFGLPGLEAEFVRRRVGRGLESLIEELVGPDRVTAGVELFRERYAEVFEAGTTLLPEVAETVDELARRGYRMAVASNKPARFGRPILRSVGLEARFDPIQGPDLAGATKPDPAMIQACLAGLETTPNDSVYIGDMALDVESGRRAGLPVWLVCGGSAEPAELHATGRPVLSSLGTLLDWLPGV